MKKFLIFCSFFTLISNIFADHKLDFNDDKDVVTCKNGEYTLSKNSTKEEILQNCIPISTTISKGSAKLTKVKFFGDNNVKVACSLKKDKVNECTIRD